MRHVGVTSDPKDVAAQDQLTWLLQRGEQNVSAATTLAIGRMALCTGGGYTVTLPAVAASSGKVIGVRLAGNAGRIALKGAGSELIDGQNQRVLWAGECAILYCDGTAWAKIGGRTVPMAAAAYPSGEVIVPATVRTYLNLNMPIYGADTGILTPADGSFTIQRTGRYSIQAVGYYRTGSADIQSMQCAVSKNGSPGGTGAYLFGLVIPANVYFKNIYTDVVSLAAGDNMRMSMYHEGGSSRTMYTGDPVWTFMTILEHPTW